MNPLDRRIVEIVKTMSKANPAISDQTWKQAAEQLNSEGFTGGRLWDGALLKSYCREMVRRNQGHAAGSPTVNHREQDAHSAARDHLKVINGVGEQRTLKKGGQAVIHERTGISQEDALVGARTILEKIQTREKEYTGGCYKKMSTVKTKIVGARLPVDLINELNRLGGSKTYHLERAVRLYLKILDD